MPLPDVDDLAALGGTFQNYASVEDPNTDCDAAFFNKNNANNAAMTQTLPRAICTFVGNATTPTDPPSGFVHAAVWGASAPVKPTPARTGAGVYTLTFPTTVTDELGDSHTVNFRRAHGFAEGSTAYHVQVEVTSANVLTVRVFDAGGTPNDAAGVNLTVIGY